MYQPPLALQRPVLGAFAALLALLALTCATQVNASEPQQPKIFVSGEGSATLAPDLAILNLTVAREAETARAALDANNAAMGDVLKAMRAQGIEDKDLQTSNFSIQPRYHYPPETRQGERKPPQIVGYIVRNSLTVRIRDLTSLGAVLDQSVSLGVNEGGNVTFGNADPAAAVSEARIQAVRQAKTKAQTLASAAGVKLGDILEISEQSHSPRPVMMARSAMMMESASDSVPIASGENTYKVSVSMQFAIVQ